MNYSTLTAPQVTTESTGEPRTMDTNTHAYLERLAQDVQSAALYMQQEGTVPRPKKNKGYTPPESQPYIGLRTAMEILGLTKQGVMRVIKAGHIPSAYQADKPNGKWIMLRTEVEALKNERDSN